MERKCDYCGVEYLPKRNTSRYHSPSCRAMASKARTAGQVVEMPRPTSDKSELVEATRTELTEAGKVGSSLGQQALALATRIASGHDSGSSVAALSKELRAVMDVALGEVIPAADPVDELRKLRDRKRRAAAG